MCKKEISKFIYDDCEHIKKCCQEAIETNSKLDCNTCENLDELGQHEFNEYKKYKMCDDRLG